MRERILEYPLHGTLPGTVLLPTLGLFPGSALSLCLSDSIIIPCNYSGPLTACGDEWAQNKGTAVGGTARCKYIRELPQAVRNWHLNSYNPSFIRILRQLSFCSLDNCMLCSTASRKLCF